MKYRVAYAAGSRADYGIVRRYLAYLKDDENIKLDVLVTGSLLETQYGCGYHIIEEDGFDISVKILLNLDSSNNSHIIRSMAIALDKFGEYFENTKYDLLIILGDRYEMLSVAIAAAMNKIPILHIHGGEITLGNYDEFIRHSITKMAHFHFTSTEKYRKRVIQLGEPPENVFNIGAMGSENCKSINLDNVEESILPISDKKYFVILFHPETLTYAEPLEQVKTILNVVNNYIGEYRFIFIGSNSDTGSDKIRQEIQKYVKNNKNAVYYENFHPDSYHFLVKHSLALIGNSSSGIIEAPTLGAYTINIGDRQKGRVRGTSVIDVECKADLIKKALEKVIKAEKKEEFDNPYYQYDSSSKAYRLTLSLLRKKKEVKRFYDI